MGGEKQIQGKLSSTGRGSPPHGRGKASIASLGCWCNRITPAWAGKRYNATLKNASPRDHPRMGGEKSDRSLSAFWM